MKGLKNMIRGSRWSNSLENYRGWGSDPSGKIIGEDVPHSFDLSALVLLRRRGRTKKLAKCNARRSRQWDTQLPVQLICLG
jgi:hypothetical protein